MKKRLSLVLAILIVLSLFSLPAIAADTLSVKGAGVENPYEISAGDLSKMTRTTAVYSTVNTFPTQKIIVYSGVMLEDIIKTAGLKDTATLIKVSSTDGFAQTFTVGELLEAKRWFFPDILKNDSSGAVEVKPMIALMSGESADKLEPCEPTLVMGQRAITEQTNPYFCKYVASIEVMIDTPDTLAPVTAIQGDGEITLSHPNTTAKIYYTIDGSEPSIGSTLYNVSAPNFQPELNKPVAASEGTVVKAIAIAPGKLESAVASFAYSKSAVSFTDLSGYSWAQEAIYGLVEKDIIAGMGGTIFAPGQNLTRAQFAKMIVLAIDGKEPAAVETGKFPDVAKGSWYISYVERASALGLIQGYTDGTFGPNRNVTREEMFAILVRAMGFDEAAKQLSGKGLDAIGYLLPNDTSDWAIGYIEMAEDLGLIERGHISRANKDSYGNDFIWFSGRLTAKRAEAAESVWRMLLRLAEIKAAQ